MGTPASWHNGLALADCGAELCIFGDKIRPFMDYLETIFVPTGNRRLNELVGFLMCVSALLLLPRARFVFAARSFVEQRLGAHRIARRPQLDRRRRRLSADAVLQFFGIGAFLLVIFPVMLGVRWFRSKKIQSPLAKTLGGIWLLMFVPAMLALLPGQIRWMRVIPIEGLMGRVVGDFLIHYLNLAGAYIVCATVLAVALYLSTAFSFSAIRLWAPTRFAFATALWSRYQDWKRERLKKRQQKELDQRRISKPIVKTQLIPSRPAPASQPQEPRRTGIERMLEEEAPPISRQATTGGILRGISGLFRTTADRCRPRGHAASRQQQQGKDDHAANCRRIQTAVQQPLAAPRRATSRRCRRTQTARASVDREVRRVRSSRPDHADQPWPRRNNIRIQAGSGHQVQPSHQFVDDLCLALKAESILIERMAGKSTVGLQVPNRQREIIWLRENIESQEFMGSKSRLTMAMGKDINGRIVTADLAGMPHLLIAGSTGAGKSVAINAMIMSILYKATPDQVRLILVDPKRLELGNYEGVPHLYTPIITEPKLAANALRNAVREMERRLKLLAAKGVRNIDQYNKLFDQGGTPSLFEEGSEEKPIPYIVIIIDELADLMMLDSSNVEESITRLAQMARAVGIHLVLATQRPSVDVITGLIKANFPARVSFRVATKVDSRTILDANGAEALLGKGDMLYLPSGSARVHRLHAPFVTEKEIAAVVEFWKAQGLAEYQQQFLEAPKGEREAGSDGGHGQAGTDGESEDDPMYGDAVKLVIEFGKASTSLLQRRLRIGYGRAAHLIDLMEQDGIVGAADGPKPREVLKRPDWISEIEETMR